MSGHPLVLATLLLGASLASQNPVTVLLTGRFDANSLETGGGSLSNLREFDLMAATPDATNGCAAFSFLPSTAHQAMMGDAYNDGNFCRFNGLKASVFRRFNFTAPFVKYADRGTADARRVFWTVRDTITTSPVFPVMNYQILIAGGTATTTFLPGDFIRWNRNGSPEYFLTQALVMKAAGLQTGTFASGADGLCQDAAGNLYYSPAEGGHWVNGATLRVYCNDGSLCMIPAAAITYDANGNVADTVYGSAIPLAEEIANGPAAEPALRTMMRNAGAQNYAGALITISNNTTGLAIDPNGGTWTGYYTETATNTQPTVPHFVWVDDGGSYACTVFSTRLNPVNNLPGSVAVINGVTMGSTTAGVPATGAYLGFRQDVPNFQPTPMGIALITPGFAPNAPQGAFVADAPRDGVVAIADPTINVDFGGIQSFGLVIPALGFGPARGGFLFSADVSSILGGFGEFYALVGPLIFLPSGVADVKGFYSMSLPNPQDPSLLGAGFVIQGLGVAGASFLVSTPVQMMFR